MTKVFDEAYAQYLNSLSKLDTTHDISAKNILFRQLTEQLSEMENRIKSHRDRLSHDDPTSGEDQEL